MISKILSTFVSSVLVAVAGSSMAIASCIGDCHDNCYELFGDEPRSLPYVSCVWECNDLCDPFNGI